MRPPGSMRHKSTTSRFQLFFTRYIESRPCRFSIRGYSISLAAQIIRLVQRSTSLKLAHFGTPPAASFLRSDFRTVGHGSVPVVVPLNGIMILVKIVGAAMMQAALTLHDFELIPIYIMAGWTTIRIIRAHRTLPI